jgi:hypothetical protein
VSPIKDNPRFKLIYSRIEGLQGKKEDLLEKNTVKLYKNCNVLPRAWLVKDFKVLDQKKMISTITSKEFNPRKEVLLEEKSKFNSTSDISASPLTKGGIKGGFSEPSQDFQNEVEFTSESNNRLSLLVKAKGDAFLVLSDTYFPGWRVFIDGKREKIYQADYNFRAVPLGAGTHHVEFVYDPLSFKLGTIITFLGIMGCLVIGLGVRHRKQ